MSAWRRCFGGVKALVLLLGLAGCDTLAGGPARLYTVSEEVDLARAELPGLQQQYDALTNFVDPTQEATRVYLRNEYISRRMYIIDVEYSRYEAGLTSDKQLFSFGADTTAQVLNVIGAATTVGSTSRVLNGVAGGVGAVNGFYDKDLIIAKTIQIVEAQMRAQRDIVAKNILKGMVQPSLTYPLSRALSDLEDYYRAGTFNTGVIEATKQAGQAQADAAQDKALVIQAGAFEPTEDTVVWAMKYFAPGPNHAARVTAMDTCLYQAGFRGPNGAKPHSLDYATGAAFRPQRQAMMRCAAANPSL